MSHPSSDPPPAGPSPRAGASWLPAWMMALADRPVAVLLICFTVTGVLGVPLILASRAFSPTMKVVWTVVVTAYTAALVACVAGIVYSVYQSAASLYGM